MFCNTATKRSIIAVSATILMLAATTASAKCKYQADMANVFTGEHVRWTQWKTFNLAITTDPYALVNGIAEGDRKYFGLRVRSKSTLPRPATKDDLDNAFVVPAGAKVLLLLADDSVVELKTDEKFTGDSDFFLRNDGRSDIGTDTLLKVPLNAENLNALTAQRVKQIRLSTTAGDVDLPFGKKGSKRMQEVLECIR